MKFCSVRGINVSENLPESDISVFLPIGFELQDSCWITLERGYIKIIEKCVDIESGSTAYNWKLSAIPNIGNCLFRIISE